MTAIVLKDIQLNCDRPGCREVVNTAGVAQTVTEIRQYARDDGWSSRWEGSNVGGGPKRHLVDYCPEHK